MDDRVARRAQRHDLSNVRLFPRPGPRLYTFGAWWVFGLYVLFFAAAPHTPSIADEQTYSELMQQAIFSDAMREAQQEAVSAKRHLDEVHVWGWRWRPPFDQQVPPRQRAFEMAEGRLREALRDRDALQSEAKAAVGLWSPYGVDEVRDRFWAAYESGKDFAKRMTWWDVVFGIGGRNRDEELLGTLLRWLGQIMMNFTVGKPRRRHAAPPPQPHQRVTLRRPTSHLSLPLSLPLSGLISALISFMFSLLSMIWEYKASYLSGFLFFFVAMVRRHASPPSLCALTTAQLRLTTTHRVLSAVGRFCDGRHLCGRHVRDGCRWRVRADPEQRARPTPRGRA